MVYSQAYMLLLGLALIAIDRMTSNLPNKPQLPLFVWGAVVILVGVGMPIVSEKRAVPITICVMMLAATPFVKGKLQLALEMAGTAIFGLLIFGFFKAL